MGNGEYEDTFLGQQSVWTEDVTIADESRLIENSSVETLWLSECLLKNRDSGEMLTDAFLAQFKGIKNLSLIGSEQGPESYDCLAEYEHLESLYLEMVPLTEEQSRELKPWEEKIEVTYR